MPNINKVILAGNLTRDPEIRVTPKGAQICNFSIAINRIWKDSSGEQQQETTFVECTAFGKTADNIARFFTKGRAILIDDGRLQFEQWEDKDTGKKRSRLSVIANTFQFCDSKQEEGQDAAPRNRPQPRRPDPRPAYDPYDNGDEEVPF